MLDIEKVMCGKPQPKQIEFLKAVARFVCYGGSRGGGKSWVVRYKAITLCENYPGIKILILRRTMPELRDNHIRPMQKILHGYAKYKDKEKIMEFPNGSFIRFGYCDREGDVDQYQGQEYDVIFMDEGTHFTEYQFKCLTACMRGDAEKYPKRFYVTCNPGGVGHAWVKRLFIDKQYRKGEIDTDYQFIPASLFDNQYLMTHDKGYVDMLNGLPEDQKEAWLYGRWDVFSGQFFPEFKEEIHVISPLTSLPANCNYYYVHDYGRSDMLAGLWIAVDSQNNAYIYREIFKSGLVTSAAAKEILKCESDSERNQISIRLQPPDLWSKDKTNGISPADIYSNFGLYFMKADNSRVNGWMAVREWLLPYETEVNGQTVKTARLKIYSTCKNLIRSLSLLQYSDSKHNDAATEPHELTHATDALRYFCASRPQPGNLPAKNPNFPFEDMEEEYLDKVNPLRHMLGGEITHDYITAGGYD